MALSLAAEGMSLREMAGRMNVGLTSLKQHMKSAMRKLGTNQRAEAVAAGIRRGVI
jgi:DNA-binding CsgD family transcriptional regulator